MRLQRTLQLVLFSAAVLVVFQAAPVRAFAEKTFAVAPFSINGPSKYAYLKKGIQDMFNSRLSWTDHFRPIGRATVDKGIGSTTVTSDNAQKMIGILGCDYLIYGSVTIMGDQCSLDVRVTEREADTWPKTAQTTLANLIPAFSRVANAINSEVFKKPGADTKTGQEKAGATTGKKGKNAMNPMLIHNQANGKDEVYLNPQFRYAGDAGMSGRQRSQSLPYVGSSCIVGDADGDGVNEVFIASKHKVRAYQYDAEGNMRPKSEYEIGNLQQILRLSMLDLNGDGYQEIVASVIDGMGFQDTTSSAQNNASSPKSFILNYKDGVFSVVAKDIRYFLTTVRLPPDYRPALVGQRKGSRQYFGNTVSEMIKMSGEWQAGGALLLPPEANVFNFTYLPLPQGQYKIIVADHNDKLRVYTRTGDRQYTTDEVYCASSLGLEDDTSATGLKDRLIMKTPYYVPQRMIPADLDKDGKNELLVNHPVSVASQFFERYRYFPQGEIHSLAWDGVGLSLLWKTRRIKGSVADLGIADVNNDGVMDLYALVVSHPGMLGVKFRRTVLLSYPLDTSQQSGKVDQEFTQE